MNATYPACEAGFDAATMTEDEKPLVAAGKSGLPYVPEGADRKFVRGALIRRLLTGEAPGCPALTKPLRINNLHVRGDIDLDDQSMIRPFFAENCFFEGALRAHRSNLRYIELKACTIGRVPNSGERIAIEGSTLPQGISLTGSTINGEVRLSFTSVGGIARLSGTKIFNAFQSPDHGSAVNRGCYALNCEGSSFAADLILDQDFSALGAVWLVGVRIAGDLYCDGGTFQNPLPDGAAEGAEPRDAIVLERSTIEGGFCFCGVKSVEGNILVGSLSAAVLIDDPESWAKAETLSLSGFVFPSIGGDSTMAWKDRRDWLKKQSPFARQPWEQTMAALRSMGHRWDAECLAMEFQDELRTKLFVRKTGAGGVGLRLFHRLYGWLVGYGYRPGRTVWALIALWLISGLVFHFAASAGVFVPSDASIYLNSEFADCRAALQWVGCPQLAAEYPSYNAGIYALDLILPIIDLRVESQWMPTSTTFFGQIIRVITWVDVLLGWVGSLALVAATTKLFRHEGAGS